MHTHVVAKEVNLNVFGIGAPIKQKDPQEFIVKTKGFVYTPKEKFTTNKIKYKIQQKGKGKHYLVIEETDARGTFINEKKWLLNYLMFGNGIPYPII